MQDSNPWPLHGNQGLAPLSQQALKLYAFHTGILFSFSTWLWGTVEEEIPSSSTASRFMEQYENICPVFETAEEGKRNVVFYGFMKTETLICFAWGLSLF
jgi:hypothetical protein